MSKKDQGKILYSLIARSPTDVLIECHATGEPKDKSQNGIYKCFNFTPFHPLSMICMFEKGDRIEF